MDNLVNAYTIFKKRDGQDFKPVGQIHGCEDFAEAKIKFARQMTDDNWNQSNNVQWLDKEQDGVLETGWYDFNGGIPLYDEATEKYDATEVKDFLMVSEVDILEGFDTWSEDVYTWRIYHRICDATGEGMNEGFVFTDKYFKHEKDALDYAISEGFKDLDDSYESGFHYYTEWDE